MLKKWFGKKREKEAVKKEIKITGELIELSRGVIVNPEGKKILNRDGLDDESVMHIVIRAKAKLSQQKTICKIIGGKVALVSGWEIIQC